MIFFVRLLLLTLFFAAVSCSRDDDDSFVVLTPLIKNDTITLAPDKSAEFRLTAESRPSISQGNIKAELFTPENLPVSDEYMTASVVPFGGKLDKIGVTAVVHADSDASAGFYTLRISASNDKGNSSAIFCTVHIL